MMPAVRPAPLRILVVEDEMMVAMLIEDMLIELGYDPVGPFVRVEAALKAARELRIDAAVLDFNLNGENTYPVAWTLRERNVPFIFSTGYGTSILNDSFMGIPLLQKPFQRDELGWAIRRAIEQAKSHPYKFGARVS
jgi:DNA-binding response OmpR family regulator